MTSPYSLQFGSHFSAQLKPSLNRNDNKGLAIQHIKTAYAGAIDPAAVADSDSTASFIRHIDPSYVPLAKKPAIQSLLNRYTNACFSHSSYSGNGTSTRLWYVCAPDGHTPLMTILETEDSIDIFCIDEIDDMVKKKAQDKDFNKAFPELIEQPETSIPTSKALDSINDYLREKHSAAEVPKTLFAIA